MTPTQRSLAECKRRGWEPAQVVERWNAFARVRIDLFGCIDLVAVSPERGIVGIQATSTANVPARIHKIQTQCNEAISAWVRAGAVLFVWGWAKRGGRGKRKLWTLKEREVTEEML